MTASPWGRGPWRTEVRWPAQGHSHKVKAVGRRTLGRVHSLGKDSRAKFPISFSLAYLEEIPWVLLYVVRSFPYFKADKDILLYFFFLLAISCLLWSESPFYHICFTNVKSHYRKPTIFKTIVDRDYCVFQNFDEILEGPRTLSYLLIEVDQITYLLSISRKELCWKNFGQ